MARENLSTTWKGGRSVLLTSLFPKNLYGAQVTPLMKHKIFVIVVFLTFFAACAEQSKGPENDKAPESHEVPESYSDILLPENRGFDMALSPVFVLKDIEDRYENLMKELASVSDIYFTQNEVIWDFERGVDITSEEYERTYLTFLTIAKTLKLKNGYVGISVLNMERNRILENPFSDTFSDERVKRACKNMALRIVKDFNPKYLCVGVEVSSYSHENPKDFEHFVVMYNDVYSAVKAVSPHTVVFPTFHYEEFLGVLPWHSHTPDWELLHHLNMDAFAITTYPYMNYSLEEIPKDYYTQIRMHTDLPLIIAESGFASHCCGITIKDLHGSEEAQKEYLLVLLDTNEEMNTLLWVYWSLYDYEPLRWGGTDKNDVFNSIGLHYADGTPKPAFYVWVKIFELPRSSST